MAKFSLFDFWPGHRYDTATQKFRAKKRISLLKLVISKIDSTILLSIAPRKWKIVVFPDVVPCNSSAISVFEKLENISVKVVSSM